MTEEARKLVATLRYCDLFKDNNAKCSECPTAGKYCIKKNGTIIQVSADLIESLSEQLDQVTRERDAETELIGKLIVILKKYPNAATNGCAYNAYMEIKKWLLDMRGVEVEG